MISSCDHCRKHCQKDTGRMNLLHKTKRVLWVCSCRLNPYNSTLISITRLINTGPRSEQLLSTRSTAAEPHACRNEHRDGVTQAARPTPQAPCHCSSELWQALLSREPVGGRSA